MAHGEHPTLKQIKNTTHQYCETCKHEMRLQNKNRCEMHMSLKEPCYYCHLILHHMNGDKTKDSKNSPKKSLTQKA